MMRSGRDYILECVPNLSEGRLADGIDRMVSAAQAPGVRLLDLSSDVDHNRTVLTLAGSKGGLEESLLGLCRAALEEIDLRRQEGEHPRIGAVDVVPFIPLGETSMAVAVDAAQSLGSRLATELDLPVFLYEEAATAPHRRNLAALRKGGLEDLGRRLLEPQWRPDFGPARLHPTAGAVAVGARFFLVAFNALLDTSDVRIARQVARAVREATGGLPAVKALGLHLASRGGAQVSMNLVDYRRTSVPEALRAVRAAATGLGVSVIETEIVGLAPRAAFAGATREELSLSSSVEDRLLERALEVC